MNNSYKTPIDLSEFRSPKQLIADQLKQVMDYRTELAAKIERNQNAIDVTTEQIREADKLIAYYQVAIDSVPNK